MSDDTMPRHDARTFLARREGQPPLDDDFAGDAVGAERYLTAPDAVTESSQPNEQHRDPT